MPRRSEIEHDCTVVGSIIGKKFLEHFGEAVDGIHRLTAGPSQGADGEKGAVDRGIGVDQQNLGGHHAASVSCASKQDKSILPSGRGSNEFEATPEGDCYRLNAARRQDAASMRGRNRQ